MNTSSTYELTSDFKDNRIYDLDQLKCSYNKVPKGLERILSDGGTLRVFLAILSLEEVGHLGDKWANTGMCHVSDEIIAEYLDLHVNTVRRHLAVLSDLGLVKSERIPGNRFNTKYYDFRVMVAVQRDIDKLLKDTGVKKRFRREESPRLKEDDEVSELPLEVGYTGTICADDERSHRHRTQCSKGYTGTVRGAYTNNNTNKNNSYKTTREVEPREDGEGEEIPSLEYSPSPRNQVVEIVNVSAIGAELDSIPTNFGITESQNPITSKAKAKKLKGIERLLSGGEATAKDIVEYFAKKYLETFNLPYYRKNDTSPKSLAILKNSFMDKYPMDQWVSIIDSVIEYYDKCPSIPKDKYPYPTVTSLTQPWLISLILATAKRAEKLKKATELRLEGQKSKAQKIALAPFDMRLIYRFDELGPEGDRLVDLFNEKYEQGLLNDKPWLTDMSYPIERIKEELENA